MTEEVTKDPIIRLRQMVINDALARVGKARYSLYANGSKENGVELFDCSSFTQKMWLYATKRFISDEEPAYLKNFAPLTVPHSSVEQSYCSDMVRVDPAQEPILNGDFLYYYHPISHVGLAWWHPGTRVLYVIQASDPLLGINAVRYEAYAPIVGVTRPKKYFNRLRKAVGFNTDHRVSLGHSDHNDIAIQQGNYEHTLDMTLGDSW
jgi:hypothetical protein